VQLYLKSPFFGDEPLKVRRSSAVLQDQPGIAAEQQGDLAQESLLPPLVCQLTINIWPV
jgi:hypothetical protein